GSETGFGCRLNPAIATIAVPTAAQAASRRREGAKCVENSDCCGGLFCDGYGGFVCAAPG
ncbi:hypothetical protein OAC00_04630, partial [Amylibacter sp.]|nr:hypothetical protein [Amylibacter sp.]